MSIDKNSNGVPEVDFSKKTTKVNMGIIIGVISFFVMMGVIVLWFAKRGGAT